MTTKKNYSVGSQQRTSESGYAEANAKAELIADEKEKRIGIQGELGVKAGVGRAGGEATTDILGVLKVKANVEGEREATGISAKGGGYLDFDDLEANVNIGGELAVLLGLKFDLSVTLSAKPITNFITNTVEYISDVLGLIAPKDGLVLTGSSTVIIGG